MKADNKDETAGKVTITGDGRMVPEKAKIAPELEAVQHLMPMSADDREALRESIKKDGIREPLRGYSVGMTFYVLSGFNRLSIARELNAEARKAAREAAKEAGASDEAADEAAVKAVVPFPLVKTETIETDDREAFAVAENVARRHLSLEDKRNLAAYYLEKFWETSNAAIAKKCTLSDKTIQDVRNEMVARRLVTEKPTLTVSEVSKLSGLNPKRTESVVEQISERRSENPNADMPPMAPSRSENPNVGKRTDSKGRKQPARKPARTSPKATGKAQSSAASQGKGKGRGENEKALRAFASGLNNSLRGVELENAQTLKAAVGIAKAWLKDVERKARSANG